MWLNAPKPGLILLSLLLAWLLAIIPMPLWAAYFRPDWVALVVLFWNLRLPQTFNVGSAWIAGIGLDLLLGSPLGLHALAMIVMSYLTIRLNKQLPLYSVFLQIIAVTTLLATYRGLLLWMYGMTGHAPSPWPYWAPLITSILIWPWLNRLLGELNSKD